MTQPSGTVKRDSEHYTPVIAFYDSETNEIKNVTPLTALPVVFGAAGGADTYDSQEYEASGVIKEAAGTFFGLMGYNSSASAQFILIFDAAAVPADDAVPKVIVKVPAESSFSISFAPFGKQFANGICWSNSSTGATKTIGSADVWINALYK
jgi:hypothetical protein